MTAWIRMDSDQDRRQRRRHGHDCIWDRCKLTDFPCELEPPRDRNRIGPRNHGISGERWEYVVSNEKAALRLVVSTDIMPPTVPGSHMASTHARPLKERRQGAYLSLHRVPDNGNGEACDLLPNGRCIPEDLGALYVDRFFKEHGDPSEFDQPESFWNAMEDELSSHTSCSGGEPFPPCQISAEGLLVVHHTEREAQQIYDELSSQWLHASPGLKGLAKTLRKFLKEKS